DHEIRSRRNVKGDVPAPVWPPVSLVSDNAGAYRRVCTQIAFHRYAARVVNHDDFDIPVGLCAYGVICVLKRGFGVVGCDDHGTQAATVPRSRQYLAGRQGCKERTWGCLTLPHKAHAGGGEEAVQGM